jgi:hypothetical protein
MNQISICAAFRTVTRVAALTAVVALLTSPGWAAVIDFEAPAYSLSDVSDTNDVGNPLGGQDGWVGGTSTPEAAVVATVNSGLYVGGQAAGHVDSGGSENHGRLGPSPAVGNTMQADFFGGDAAFDLFDDDGAADSNLRMNGWVDVDGEGDYDSGSSAGEKGFQFGLDSEAKFGIQFANSTSEIASTDTGQSGATFSSDSWYRIKASWVDNVAGGKDVTITAFDLTNNSDLGTVIFATLSDAEFGPDPATYEGVGFRSTRGLLDNIVVVPEPSSIVLCLLGFSVLTYRRQS